MNRNKRFQTFKRGFRGRFWSKAVICLGLFLLTSPSQAEFRSTVGVGFAGDFFFVEDTNNNGQGFGNLFIENVGRRGRSRMNVGAGGLIGASGHTYIKAPEIFHQFGRKDTPASLYIGRWKTKWSATDDLWHMGMTQPLFLWDASRPERQGLTGVFLDFPEVGDFHFTFFASYLFIPSQGSTYEISDGKLISSNPWFVDPIEAVTFSGERIDLNYSIETPPAKDVVFKHSFGLSMKYNELKQGMFFNSYYLNKPQNDLLLPFSGALNLGTFRGDITVQPVVARHQTAGADIGFRKSWGEFFLSWLYEGDVKFSPAENTTYPIVPDQNIYSSTLKWNYSDNHEIYLSYLQVERDETGVGGTFASSPIDVFAGRNRFEKAAKLKWMGRFWPKQGMYTLRTNLSITYDTEDQATWASGLITWLVNPGFELFTQCDLFGSPKEVIVGTDFLDRYQNNDRCLMGGYYAF